MFKKGQVFQTKIHDMTHDGQGIGHADGLAVFVPGTVAGDTVTVELTKMEKNYALARLIAVDIASDGRIAPLCPCTTAGCGGCRLGYLCYEEQLKLKERQLKDKLVRLGGAKDPPVKPIMAMKEPFRYRNKAQFPISAGSAQSPITIGFYKSQTHQVVHCHDCLLQSKAAMAAAEVVRQFMKENHMTAWDEPRENGLMRHLIVKTAFGTGEVMVILVINGNGLAHKEKLIELLDRAVYSAGYSLESVILNINKKGTSQIMGPEWVTLAGKPTILERMGELNFEISPMSFYQTNPLQMKVLYEKVADYAQLTGNEYVLDLYCGVGAIGLSCAKQARQVVGIESVRQAVLDANRNAAINGVVNARFVCGKAEEELPRLFGTGKATDEQPQSQKVTDRQPQLQGADETNPVANCVRHADVIILDPPRAGCKPKLLQAVADVKPDRIIYVSCDPATLARDVKILTNLGYAFVEATPVDMFPWTMHIETVALLQRN